LISPDLPELKFSEWEATCDTVHMWTQIVGKTRMTLSPMENHYWNATLYVTPRGLTTAPIPYPKGTFDVAFDFISHELTIRSSGGDERAVALAARPVAEFYTDYMSQLRAMEIDVKIHTKPDEFDDPVHFDQDTRHASYDKEYVERFRQILIWADRVLKLFRCRFIGKASPVHFFWGSFDLAVTRFSGRRAPEREGADPITREAYSHEVSSCGFWPGDRRFPYPAFYAYAAPSPAGIENEPAHPGGWNPQLGEFILKYDDVRAAGDPEKAVLDFCQSSYEAAAKLAHWDRKALER
jgi:Family of unknown function (DUF5996)